ncbi:hypothetical protein SS50377_21233 [Spironucleus salmonicida]|uniref:Uncharacterized protein n=1 Tax=Spironucleus salmonicida TaxID=348837 RepID=A0A9P8S229_9EUKA|nr:hypothetical protein SS50377_21233 [Spironucleus salmonicida]
MESSSFLEDSIISEKQSLFKRLKIRKQKSKKIINISIPAKLDRLEFTSSNIMMKLKVYLFPSLSNIIINQIITIDIHEPMSNIFFYLNLFDIQLINISLNVTINQQSVQSFSESNITKNCCFYAKKIKTQ